MSTLKPLHELLQDSNAEYYSKKVEEEALFESLFLNALQERKKKISPSKFKMEPREAKVG